MLAFADGNVSLYVLAAGVRDDGHRGQTSVHDAREAQRAHRRDDGGGLRA
jgi:hypothetical protein